MKQVIAFVTLLGLLFAVATPIAAQEDQVNVEFRITVNANCPNATYWGFIGPPESEYSMIQLADTDGDGIYTGNTEVGRGEQWVVALVQGTGVQDTVYGPGPGQPSRTIQDFGTVTVSDDQTFEGSVSNCPSQLPGTGLANMNPTVPLLVGALLLAAGVGIRRTRRFA